MLNRVIYLQSTINSFIDNHLEYQDLKLTPIEWEQIKFLHDLFHSFKIYNNRMKAISQLDIDKVFSIYEILFNEFNRLSKILKDFTYNNHK